LSALRVPAGWLPGLGIRSAPMESADVAVVHTYLQSQFPSSEIWQVVAMYQLDRVRESDGSHQNVDIQIVHSPQFGYVVNAVDAANPHVTATCNGNPELNVALMTTHWQDLDRADSGPANAAS
jgi:hypothetical protein